MKVEDLKGTLIQRLRIEYRPAEFNLDFCMNGGVDVWKDKEDDRLWSTEVQNMIIDSSRFLLMALLWRDMGMIIMRAEWNECVKSVYVYSVCRCFAIGCGEGATTDYVELRNKIIKRLYCSSDTLKDLVHPFLEVRIFGFNRLEWKKRVNDNFAPLLWFIPTYLMQSTTALDPSILIVAFFSLTSPVTSPNCSSKKSNTSSYSMSICSCVWAWEESPSEWLCLHGWLLAVFTKKNDRG